MPRAGLSTAAVVDAALAVVDEHGEGALTLAAVAQRTGVATPSLYKHVAGLGELRTLLGARVIEDMAERFTDAVLGRGGDDAVTALMHAYRAYVREHPARYAAMPLDPLHDPALAPAGTKLLEVVLGALRAYDLDPSAAVHATRCLRAVAHGFASLEAGGGFGLPEDLDHTYDQLIAAVIDGVLRD
ncbi:TetR-like C-terminal domain-containing protein [Actinophytocola oryzae]|uniref:TetR family transcriptional regulator n=1 Tax=Actinophytocola oryzae TaxID=502181 RepID=A0A4R7VYE9_9PSEU|nr:TetR-like C-terminal domain-containing protein [Actinophytocola oryzae]TDV55206.1 TetR family transcriptional regulator [Actinophytocola oryzae]